MRKGLLILFVLIVIAFGMIGLAQDNSNTDVHVDDSMSTSYIGS